MQSAKWYGDVPWEVTVGRVVLVTAEQARDIADPPGPGAWLEEQGERDSPDFGAMTVLWLARCQLEQMRGLLTDDEAEQLAARSGHVDPSEAEAADVVRDGLHLLQALLPSAFVSHAFNMAGDITMTMGPQIPALQSFGLRGSYGSEMNDPPMQLLHAAVEATHAAARWVVATRGRR
jgi:hypothetical protein